MTTTAERTVLDAVRDLAPAISERAAEIEAARRLPQDLLEDIAAAGCLRMLRPREYGGDALALPHAMRVFEELSRADASVGWTIGILAVSWCDIAGLPRPTLDAILGSAPDAVVAGVFTPGGSVTAAPGGYRVSGRWGFASGCQDATWLFLTGIEASDDGPRPRTVVLAPHEARIEDTWHVLGLAGTGSHHLVVDDVLVPAERTFSTFESPPAIDEPILRLPPPVLFSLAITSVALGIGQGALDDVRGVAQSRMPVFTRAPLATSPSFHERLATADTELRAARALVYEAADAAWASAVAGTPPSPEQFARARAAAVWATGRAIAAVDTAYRAGGGGVVYAGHVLQRRLRDVYTLAQHFLVRPEALTTAGAVLAGQEVDGLY